MDGAHTHGNGGSGGLAAIAAGAGLGVAVYLAPRLLWVVGTVAVCAVLTVAAVAALMRWMPGVRVWSREPVQLTAERVVPAVLPPAGAPALEQHVHYHAHYHAADGQPSGLPLDPLAGRQHLLRVEPAGTAAGRVQGDGHERVDDGPPQV